MGELAGAGDREAIVCAVSGIGAQETDSRSDVYKPGQGQVAVASLLSGWDSSSQESEVRGNRLKVLYAGTLGRAQGNTSGGKGSSARRRS